MTRYVGTYGCTSAAHATSTCRQRACRLSSLETQTDRQGSCRLQSTTLCDRAERGGTWEATGNENGQQSSRRGAREDGCNANRCPRCVRLAGHARARAKGAWGFEKIGAARHGRTVCGMRNLKSPSACAKMEPDRLPRNGSRCGSKSASRSQSAHSPPNRLRSHRLYDCTHKARMAARCQQASIKAGRRCKGG